MAAIEALRAAFPDHPLRLDPNAAWTPQTSVKVASGLAGILEYLEDPTPDIDGMAEVAQQAPMPLATNMCVVAFDHLAPAVAANAVKVVLSDHHYWGGLQRSRLLAGICDTFGLGPVDALELASRHQPGGDGASRRGDAEPDATPATRTGRGRPRTSSSPVCSRSATVRWPYRRPPGWVSRSTNRALAALHEQYLRCGVRDRDDTGYMKSIDPDYEAISPRW